MLAAGVVAIALFVGGCSGSREAKLVDGPPTSSAPAELTPPPPAWTVADATVSVVGLYAAPDRPDPQGRTLTNPTREGMPLVFEVKERQDGWAKVQIPARPNETTAWVRATDVSFRSVPYRIEVSVGEHRLTVFEGDDELFSAPVAVGTAQTPTPLGHFYVDATLRLADPTGAYGAGQLSIAAYSDVIFSFGGGPGQIGFHGTNQPDLIGSDVSNGCIRVTNDVVLRMLDVVPTGTPVDVVA